MKVTGKHKDLAIELPDYGMWLHYDNGPEKYIIRGAMLAKWPPRDNEIILDIGTGRGIIGIGYAKQNSTVRTICIDIWNEKEINQNSPAWVIRNAYRENVTNRINCSTAAAQKLPFKRSSFDRVVSSMCLHNIINETEQFNCFSEIARVLKPGGIFVYVDGRWDNRIPSWGVVLKWLKILDLDLVCEDDILLSQYDEDRLGFVGVMKN